MATASLAPRLVWSLSPRTRTVDVTWNNGLGYTTRLEWKFVQVPTATGSREELTLSRIAGAELPAETMDAILADVTRAVTGRGAATPTVGELPPVDPKVMARWEHLCGYEPELAAFVADWSALKLRGVMLYAASGSIGDARAYVRCLMARAS